MQKLPYKSVLVINNIFVRSNTWKSIDKNLTSSCHLSFQMIPASFKINTQLTQENFSGDILPYFIILKRAVSHTKMKDSSLESWTPLAKWMFFTSTDTVLVFGSYFKSLQNLAVHYEAWVQSRKRYYRPVGSPNTSKSAFCKANWLESEK